MRLKEIVEFATLAEASVAKLGDRRCIASKGTVVQIAGEPSSPNDKERRTALFVRVVTGACKGYELVVDRSLLRDFRQAP